MHRLPPLAPLAGAAALALIAAACGPSGAASRLDAGEADVDVDAAPDAGLDLPVDRIDGTSPDRPPIDRPRDGDTPFYGFVYAHSATELYEIHPRTLDVTRVAAFVWPEGGTDGMTDIALDRDGDMVGISHESIYAVDRETGACARLSRPDRPYNSLSFVPAEEIDPTGEEVLVAATQDDGAWYRIDPRTGISTRLGAFGSRLTSSGDIVSVTGFGTVATVRVPGESTDWLVRVNARTGEVTRRIGDVGFRSVFGLGFWAGKVYGFTSAGQFLLIDVTTGAGREVSAGEVRWWGAGVTTAAPVIE